MRLRQSGSGSTIRTTNLLKVDGDPGEMLILSLNWLGRQYLITFKLPGIPVEGLQPGKMSRHRFPVSVARRPPPSNNRWLSPGFKHHNISGPMRRVSLSRRFNFGACHLKASKFHWLVVAVLALVCFAPHSQAQAQRNKFSIVTLRWDCPIRSMAVSDQPDTCGVEP